METVRNYTTRSVDSINEARYNQESNRWEASITLLATGATHQLGSSNQAWTALALCDDYLAQLRGDLPVQVGHSGEAVQA